MTELSTNYELFPDFAGYNRNDDGGVVFSFGGMGYLWEIDLSD